jgi:hypothetical protein
MMWSAEQLGYQSYINWFQGAGSLQSYHDHEMFSRVPNMYNWYFKQPMIEVAPITHSAIWTWEIPNQPWSAYQFMSQPLQVIKDYYKKHLHFSDTVNERGKQLVEKYGIDFSKTIGLTWRGTDVVLDNRPIMPIETYFPFIDDILEKEPDLRIVCTAEETGILDPLLKRYNAVVIEEFEQVQRGTQHNPERFSARSGFERGLQPALMVWLFSKCAHYIKNRSSTGAVASWLSSGRIVSLGHPENLGFPANTDTAEIEGQLYPLSR